MPIIIYQQQAAIQQKGSGRAVIISWRTDKTRQNIIHIEPRIYAPAMHRDAASHMSYVTTPQGVVKQRKSRRKFAWPYIKARFTPLNIRH